MTEAIPKSGALLDDSSVASWLDASERVHASFLVKTAANIVGADTLEAMSATLEAGREHTRAALRLVSAACTDEVARGFGTLSDHGGNRHLDLLLRASALLDQAESLSTTAREVHVTFLGRMIVDYTQNTELHDKLKTTG